MKYGFRLHVDTGYTINNYKWKYSDYYKYNFLLSSNFLSLQVLILLNLS